MSYAIMTGVFIAVLTLLAKYCLVGLILQKKRVFLKFFTFVTSELLIGLTLYLSITVYKLDIMKILIGFSFGLVTLIILYVINFQIKTR